MKGTIALSLIFALFSNVAQADIHQGSIFAFGGGDPHVSTWSGERYEIQSKGSREWLFVENPNLSLDIHIRTKANDWWSFIEAAVISFGDETIEVKGGKQHSRYWINGEEGLSALEPREEMKVWLKQGQEVTIRQVNAKQFQIRVDLGNDEGVVIETFQEFLRVDVQANDNGGSFSNSYGLLGSFSEGAKVGRDKTTIFEDEYAFVKEWQVSTSEEVTMFRS